MSNLSSLSRGLLSAGSFNLFLVVLLGALASHALKPGMTSLQNEYWQTALFYHSIHALSLILLGLLVQKSPRLLASGKALGALNGLGIAFFAGGLYLLALGIEGLHFVIPIGGTLWLWHWAWLTWLLLKG